MEKKVTILFADDDADDRQLFFEAVKEIDETITFIGAADGQEALLRLKNETLPLPDYIFLDLRMPGTNGQECLEEIKRDSRLAHIPVIVYTTSREVTESIKLKELGAVHFMSKPTSADEIYYMISFVLGEKWV
jgi:CheY-like chemotaxis protein